MKGENCFYQGNIFFNAYSNKVSNLKTRIYGQREDDSSGELGGLLNLDVSLWILQ